MSILKGFLTKTIFLMVTGLVKLFYEIRSGGVSEDLTVLHPALPDVDFVKEASFVMVESGQSSVNIPVYIYDDTIPEIDEAILVILTRSELVEPANSSFVPRLGKNLFEN